MSICAERNLRPSMSRWRCCQEGTQWLRTSTFVLKCSTPWGGFGDIPNVHGTIVSNALIETRVDLAAGRLTAAVWLHMATRGGLRNDARWFEAALEPGCLSGSAWSELSFASRPPASVPFFSPCLRSILIVPAYYCWRISRLGLSTDYLLLIMATLLWMTGN